MMAFRVVTTLDALWSGEMAPHTVGDKRIVLINIGGQIRAYADACPHMRTPLSGGSLNGAVLTCATHGWVFDVNTGRGINPAQACLTEFATMIQGNEILVDMEQSRTGQPSFLSCEKRV
jgi:toluene monooxygenase system ferredoxin subunit